MEDEKANIIDLTESTEEEKEEEKEEEMEEEMEVDTTGVIDFPYILNCMSNSTEPFDHMLHQFLGGDQAKIEAVKYVMQQVGRYGSKGSRNVAKYKLGHDALKEICPVIKKEKKGFFSYSKDLEGVCPEELFWKMSIQKGWKPCLGGMPEQLRAVIYFFQHARRENRKLHWKDDPHIQLHMADERFTQGMKWLYHNFPQRNYFKDDLLPPGAPPGSSPFGVNPFNFRVWLESEWPNGYNDPDPNKARLQPKSVNRHVKDLVRMQRQVPVYRDMWKERHVCPVPITTLALNFAAMKDWHRRFEERQGVTDVSHGWTFGGTIRKLEDWCLQFHFQIMPNSRKKGKGWNNRKQAWIIHTRLGYYDQEYEDDDGEAA
jgi:hypothetical protein